MRDYGHSDQLGLESTPEEYLKNMLHVFDLVKPKLKKTGTCFVNLGDTYMSSGGAFRHKGYSDPKYKGGRTGDFNEPSTNKHQLIKPKSLCMIPERFAWGMIKHGWILRNKPIWWKGNHMPESVTDRFTKAYENVYFFTKGSKYNFDLDAIREPHKTQSIERYQRSVNLGANAVQGKILQRDEQNTGTPCNAPKWFREGQNAETFGSPRARASRKPYAVVDRLKDEVEYRDNLPPLDDLKFYLSTTRNGLTIDEIESIFGNQAPHHWFSGECYPSSKDWLKLKEILQFDDTYDSAMIDVKTKPSGKINNPVGKNPADVWEENTTFNINALISKWKELHPEDWNNPSDLWKINTKPYPKAHFAVFPQELVRRPILAGCPVGGHVLDMFGGSGTVADFCRKNQRECTIIELNDEYRPLIEEKCMAKIPELFKYF